MRWSFFCINYAISSFVQINFVPVSFSSEKQDFYFPFHDYYIPVIWFVPLYLLLNHCLVWYMINMLLSS
jgi:hypothetical protein